MTAVFIKEGNKDTGMPLKCMFGHIGEYSMQWRQRSGWWVYKPRHDKDC